MRDEYKETLLSGKGGFDEFHDLSSINKYINEEEDTYKVFIILHEQFPTIAASVYHVAEDILIKNKEYKICSKYLGDPIKKYENIRYLRELEYSLARENPEINEPKLQSHADNRFIGETVKLISLLTEISRLDEAKEIRKRALEYFPNEEIENSIPAVH